MEEMNFITFGVCDSKEYAESLIHKMNEELANQVKNMHLTYPVTISCGYTITNPETEKKLIDFINEADSIMYEFKQKTYEKEDYKRR